MSSRSCLPAPGLVVIFNSLVQLVPRLTHPLLVLAVLPHGQGEKSTAQLAEEDRQAARELRDREGAAAHRESMILWVVGGIVGMLGNIR